MKSVLISIQPKWCEKIVSGKKTIEVRKSRPKLETPFKVYIYCTKDGLVIYGNGKQYVTDSCEFLKGSAVEDFENSSGFYKWNGKVIGEFVCDRIYEWNYKTLQGINGLINTYFPIFLEDLEKTCLTHNDIENYGKGKRLYGWRITDLKIYDKPKELNEFKTVCKDAYYSYEDWFCKDGYGSCAVRDKEKEYPYNEECIYFDCPSCGGESCGYEDFAYCLCNGIKSVIRAPQSWCYVEEFQEEKK